MEIHHPVDFLSKNQNKGNKKKKRKWEAFCWRRWGRRIYDLVNFVLDEDGEGESMTWWTLVDTIIEEFGCTGSKVVHVGLKLDFLVFN